MWFSIKDPQSGNDHITIPKDFKSLARPTFSRIVTRTFSQRAFDVLFLNQLRASVPVSLPPFLCFFLKQCWLDGMLKHTIQPPNSSHEISIYCSVILTLQHSCGYRRDQNLRDYLIRSTLINPTSADEDRGTFPCGRFCCNTSTFLDTPGGRIDFNQNISVDTRTWSML